MTDRELNLAYHNWKISYKAYDSDSIIQPFLDENISSFPPNGSWVKTVRKSLFLSTNSMAQKLGISRPAFTQIERRESEGTITLKTLRQVAESLDCELIYGFRPKDRSPLSQRVWSSLVQNSLTIQSQRRYSNHNRGLSLGAIAKDLMEKTQFRKKAGWTERK